MKTTLYAGQNTVDVCRCFDSVQEVREWLHAREEARKVEAKIMAPSSQPGSQEIKDVQSLNDCVGRNGNLVGTDGFKLCSRGSTSLHEIRLPASKSVVGREANRKVCDNHLNGFLLRGWVWMRSGDKSVPEPAESASICQLCCTSEAVVEGLCEACLEESTKPPLSEAKRLKDAAYCLNRELVHGCLVWSEVDSQYCTYCRVRDLNTQESISKEPKKASEMERILNTRIRTIPTSSRPCTLTNGCAGTMTAALRRFRLDQPAELWWTCAICRISRVAELTRAVPDPRVRSSQLEATENASILQALDDLEEPSNTDAGEAFAHMRDILNEGAE